MLLVKKVTISLYSPLKKLSITEWIYINVQNLIYFVEYTCNFLIPIIDFILDKNMLSYK